MKKNIGIILSVIAIFGFIGIVKASSYTSTLSLGAGKSVFGSTRNYTPGNHAIAITVSSTSYAPGGSYNKLKVMLNQSKSNASYLVGQKDFTYYTNTKNLAHTWGNQQGGNYYYYFTTQIDNVTYGGITSKKVVMSS